MQQRDQAVNRNVAASEDLVNGTLRYDQSNSGASMATTTQYWTPDHLESRPIYIAPAQSAPLYSLVQTPRPDHWGPASTTAITAPKTDWKQAAEAKSQLEKLPVSIWRILLYSAIEKHPDIANMTLRMFEGAPAEINPANKYRSPAAANVSPSESIPLPTANIPTPDSIPRPVQIPTPPADVPTAMQLPYARLPTEGSVSTPAQIPTPPIRILSPKIIRAPIKPVSKKKKGNAANPDGSIDFEKQTDKIHHILFVKYEKWSCTRQRNVAYKAFDAMNEEIAKIKACVTLQSPFTTKMNAFKSLVLIADWLSDMPGSMLAREIRREFIEELKPVLFDSLDWCAGCFLPVEARRMLGQEDGDGWVEHLKLVMKQMKDFLMDERGRLQAVMFKMELRASSD